LKSVECIDAADQLAGVLQPFHHATPSAFVKHSSLRFGIGKECLESFGYGPHFDDLEQFLFAFFQGLCCASFRLFALPLLHLCGPALAFQFCLTFTFLDQSCHLDSCLSQFAYDCRDSGGEVAIYCFPLLLSPLCVRVGRIRLQAQTAGWKFVLAGPTAILCVAAPPFWSVDTQAHVLAIDISYLHLLGHLDDGETDGHGPDVDDCVALRCSKVIVGSILFRVFPLIDLCPAKLLRVRSDEYPVPAGFQGEEELVCERQGIVQTRFRHGEVDE